MEGRIRKGAAAAGHFGEPIQKSVRQPARQISADYRGPCLALEAKDLWVA